MRVSAVLPSPFHSARPPAFRAVAVPFRRLFGMVCGSWQMARAARAARLRAETHPEDTDLCADIAATARFWFAHVASFAQGYSRVIMYGSASVTDEEELL
jgi:3-(methylthio)propanoyl-CoA dehydrogenase